MNESDRPLPAVSFAEAQLYLRIRPCAACGDGPLIAEDADVVHVADSRILTVEVACKACQQRDRIQFDAGRIEIPDSPISSLGELSAGGPINPTEHPSKVIDVAGWLTLYGVIEVEARSAADPVKRRQLHISAARCIDEVLKFFDADNDLPPQDAFFSDRSRLQFREAPERFTRQHLIGLLNKLPVKRL